mmetsp:Transcript_32004/g.50253  ORF Transcript_32004/g.50253 Transcript_32004/m.50253 type:complete len:199 (-) Transcript_32004:461-1057(-)|eukprot:CAMPEP_0194579962 /NCGR_PEP_ID=MMETSP0292-20121207/13881_1 /TAXON_ID=39354 /ORGANISM="Heterosigma akashiwo, Strain CCMP2393" /LENGTH=198 /DNA_ID=CAMNT_0039433143 /DNA_START=189 /DNA_END=785 /DNA_ORIENTATION=+
MPSHSIFPNHILDGDDHLHEEDNLSYPADYPPALMGVVTEKEFDQLISYVNKQLAKPEASGKIPTWLMVTCPCAALSPCTKRKYRNRGLKQMLDEALNEQHQRHFSGNSNHLEVYRVSRPTDPDNERKTTPCIVFSWESREELVIRAASEIEPLVSDDDDDSNDDGDDDDDADGEAEEEQGGRGVGSKGSQGVSIQAL